VLVIKHTLNLRPKPPNDDGSEFHINTDKQLATLFLRNFGGQNDDGSQRFGWDGTGRLSPPSGIEPR
jgi:hypothetical protein